MSSTQGASPEFSQSFSEQELSELAKLTTPRLTKYIQWEPTETQAAFLVLDCREALYGGAAGGGKSVALLMAALQYVDVPGYHALLLRRTFAALSKPGALIDLAHDWLQGTDATWNEQQKQWTFPSGASLSFGYLDIEKDKYQYQGAAYQFIGWDELTQFTPTQYKYLFSRRRRTNEMKAAGVPMRTRAASNPGGEGHEWVKHRFFTEGPAKRRVFIPAKLQDNPHLDVEEYRESLAELPLVERLQLENGDWETKEPGEWFQREWLEIIEPEDVPTIGLTKTRYWDTASTKPHAGNKDPDFFCGVLMGEARGFYYVLHAIRFRCGPAEAEAKVAAIAEQDGKDVDIWMAQEPGSMSEMALHAYGKGPLKGYTFRGDRQTGDKRQRAKPFAAAASRKVVKLVRGAWNTDYLDELEAFPRAGVHDDQVDASSGAYDRLHSVDRGKMNATVRTPTHVPPLRAIGM